MWWQTAIEFIYEDFVYSYKEKKRRELAEEDDLETLTSYHIADVSQMDVSAINSTLNSSVDMK